ncbi:imelysin family protein [Parvibaculum sp. MBR-TMA-1.3b-4.2]|jgi:putative iron-regulated protein
MSTSIKSRRGVIALSLLLAGGTIALPAQSVLASGAGAIPAQFAMDGGSSYGATLEILGYARLVEASYQRSYEDAKKMRGVINEFLDKPTEENLTRARKAWIDARPAYLVTEAFRFYEGPIDFADEETGEEGPEAHINAWPLNEAYIDYVKGDADAGIIHDTSIPINDKTILGHDQTEDEADVTTGWHAIEFLLWGQDFNDDGPGARPASDYTPGDKFNDRRRLYLKTVTQMLVKDLSWLAMSWNMDNPNAYATDFLKLPQKEALGRILTGMATLSGFEMASERMAVALDSGDQEDEHSCFSDNTNNDFIYDQKGIANIWFGEMGDKEFAGIQDLVARVDPDLEKKVTAQIEKTTKAIAVMPHPIDQVLASPKGSDGRVKMEQAVTDLVEQGKMLVEVGKALGVKIVVATE